MVLLCCDSKNQDLFTDLWHDLDKKKEIETGTEESIDHDHESRTTSQQNSSILRLTQRSSSNDDFDLEQYEGPQSDIPITSIYFSICFSCILFIIGIIFLSVSGLIAFDFYDRKEYWDHIFTLGFLGLLTIIPGGYHLLLAYLAFKEIPGYTFQDIPTFYQ